jgi:hypothetical protein
MKYNQHKAQPAAHNKHGSNRMNQHNTDHATHKQYKSSSQNKTQHMLTTHRGQAKSTQDSTHSWRKIQTKQYAQDTTHKLHRECKVLEPIKSVGYAWLVFSHS